MTLTHFHWKVAGISLILILFVIQAVTAAPAINLNFYMMGPHMAPISNGWRIQDERFGPGIGAPVYGMHGMSCGMGMMEIYPSYALPLSEDEVIGRINDYALQYGDSVAVEDVMFFSNNVYAILVDKTTGDGLTEILLNRYTGTIGLEPGPNIVWNTRLNHPISTLLPAIYSENEARNLAIAFLNGYLPGATVLASKQFSGYYTFDFGRNDVEGMLSVHARNGDIWVHTWHGQYLGGHNEHET